MARSIPAVERLRVPWHGAAVALAAVAWVGPAAADPAIQPMSADECAAWAREQSFAQSVEGHDAEAFAAHLHEGAVFIGGGNGVVRGRAARPARD